MTSEQTDKYAYCKIENNQIAFFSFFFFQKKKKKKVFRIKFELCLETMFYASQNWNYRFVLKILNKVTHCRKSTFMVRKNKWHVISLFASNNV